MASHKCNVYLCCSDMNLALSLFSASKSCFCGNWWDKHWALAFDYGEKEIVVCDAGKEGGFLQGRMKWVTKENFEQGFSKKHCLGKHTIPKPRLEKLLKDMNAQQESIYHLIKNNCQKWALHALSLLGITAPGGIQEAEDAWWKAALASLATVGAVSSTVVAGVAVARK